MKIGQVLKRILPMAAALGLLLLFSGGAARADELRELKQQMEATTRLLQQMQERLAQLEARQKLKEQSPDERIEAVSKKTGEIEKAEPAALPDNLKWLENIKISGDLRYRHEHIDSEQVKDDGSVGWRTGRDRDRIRARLMIEALINDDWSLGFRLATGEADVLGEDILTDPVSTNQTLTRFGSHKDFWLDLAYFDYHPTSVEGLNVLGGKIKNPYYMVGKNQLIWDTDLNPEGVAVTYAKPLNSSAALHFSGGGFWLNEESSGADTSLWGAQAYLKQTIGNPDYFVVGAGFYDYGNLQGLEDEFGIGLGNTLSATGEYVNDYDILEVLAEYGTKVGQLPVAVFGTWVNNTAATTSGDTGWLVGGKLGKAKDPGSMEFAYDYRDVERDAVLSAWNSSDWNAGLTGGKGHRFELDYQITKNVQASLTYFHNENGLGSGGRDLDYRRLQADLKLKF